MQAHDTRHEALRRRVENWAERLNVATPRVRVRSMTRKWGSCSTSGTITLATDLSHQEVGFQDFVIAHELLHLRVPNHGKLFKALMSAHAPGWKTHDVDRAVNQGGVSALSRHTIRAEALGRLT